MNLIGKMDLSVSHTKTFDQYRRAEDVFTPLLFYIFTVFIFCFLPMYDGVILPVVTSQENSAAAMLHKS